MKKQHTGKHTRLKTVLAIAIPLIIGLAIIWYLNKPPKKNEKDAKAPDAAKGTIASQPIKAIDSAQFPIKPGSTSDMVKQLQAALIAAYGASVLPKYGADGNWGSETTSALKKVGVTQINSQVDYDALIAKLQSTKTIAANLSRGEDLVNKWKANVSLQLMTSGKSAVLYGVTQDSYGALVANDDNMGLASGYKYNRNDYQLVGVSNNGYVLLIVTTGPHKGLKKVLATDIALG